MNNPLFLFVGRSASGKTTIANLLGEKYGYKQVESYTTRPPRYDGEIGHLFVSKAEFDELPELAAYTLYNGNEYGTTFEQLSQCDIYVIDPPGVETLLENYEKINRPIRIIYFDSTVTTRIDRMLDRGDSDNAIVGRLHHDESSDWLGTLKDIVYYYGSIVHKNVKLYVVDASQNIDEVFDNILNYIDKGDKNGSDD